MKATLRSVRIAPKKASLIAKMVRGKTVPQAVSLLEHTNKKAARLLEQLLQSAMSNAQHNDKQDPQSLIVKSLVVNKAQTYHRGIPMARGRVRRIRKFLSHIELTLGVAVEAEKTEKTERTKTMEKKTVKTTAKASQTAKKPVQKTSTSAVKATKGSASKSKKDTASSKSKASTSSKSS